MKRTSIHLTLAKSQYKFLALTISILLALILAACGGDGGYTIRELEATSEAAATERAEEQDTTNNNRLSQMQSLAPEGSVVVDAPPSGSHDENFRFEFGQLPPSGGTHHPQWQKCGIYEFPVLPHHAIHSMEHGGVWVAYNPDISADEVAELASESRGEPFVLMAPFPDLPSPIVLTAWGVQLSLDSAEDGRVRDFIRSFTNGPQTPEPGANCAQGSTYMIEE